jgi:GNAT superfamily N-acetyltransferase
MNNNSSIIRVATPEDAQSVGSLVNALLCELSPEKNYSKEKPCHINSALILLETRKIHALLAFNENNEPIGVCTLHQCAAIYAKGVFCEISEFYVLPEHCNSGIGADIIQAAREYGQDLDWSIIEVGAPDVPRWQRTVQFYLAQGFTEVGPRLEVIL